MLRGLAIGATALLLCGFAGPPQPGFDTWGTGEAGPLSYHRLSGDCETFTHRHGRNAAWGHWRMPMAKLKLSVEGDDKGAILKVRCRDGSACIEAGKLDSLPDRISEHDIPFGSREAAQAMLHKVEDLDMACTA